jgi:hypothetical protein
MLALTLQGYRLNMIRLIVVQNLCWLTTRWHCGRCLGGAITNGRTRRVSTRSLARLWAGWIFPISRRSQFYELHPTNIAGAGFQVGVAPARVR